MRIVWLRATSVRHGSLLRTTRSMRPPGAMRKPSCPRAPACLRMALSVGDAVPPEVLKECCSVQAQRAGKRALLFFYEGDEACAAELAALDEVGGELFLRGCDVHAVP